MLVYLSYLHNGAQLTLSALIILTTYATVCSNKVGGLSNVKPTYFSVSLLLYIFDGLVSFIL